MRFVYRLLILFLFPFGASAVDQPVIHIAPGHQEIISAAGVSRASIGQPEIADVRAVPESKQVIVMGKRTGSTDLILWFKGSRKKTYTIVVSTGQRSLLAEVQEFLKGIEGIEIRELSGKVIIDGQILRGADLVRIERAEEIYPSVKRFATVNSDALKFIAGEMETALRNAGMATVSVRPAGETLFLEGSVGSKSEARKVKKISESIYSNVSNHVVVGVEKEQMILVDVKLMEVKTNSLGQIGLKWPGQIDATGNLAYSTAGNVGSISLGDQTVSLRALVEKGVGRLLSNPKLLCRSGTPASFLAGGEIPIRLTGERVAQVMFKSYGVGLNITATSDRTQSVFLDIDATISDLDSATAVDNIPGILEHKVKTAANLKFGETVALAGLIENRSRKNIQKVPILGHIPIIGELFKSRDFQNNQSDFLVFLTPLPIGPGSATNSTILKEMDQKMEKGKKDVQLSIFD